ncbi:MAG: hypothetical protein OXC07_01175 [Kistimonas sp.]|nr:hypothetical protein [Kistimonas sp.]
MGAGLSCDGPLASIHALTIHALAIHALATHSLTIRPMATTRSLAFNKKQKTGNKKQETRSSKMNEPGNLAPGCLFSGRCIPPWSSQKKHYPVAFSLAGGSLAVRTP